MMDLGHPWPAGDRVRRKQGAGPRLRQALAENGVALVVNARGAVRRWRPPRPRSGPRTMWR